MIISSLLDNFWFDSEFGKRVVLTASKTIEKLWSIEKGSNKLILDTVSNHNNSSKTFSNENCLD